MFRLLVLLCSLVVINGQFGQRTVTRTVTRSGGQSGGGIQVIPASGLSGQIQFSNLAQSLPSSSFDEIDGITGYQLVPIRGRTRPAVYTTEVRESGTSGGIAVVGNGGSSQTQTDVTEEVAVDPPLPPLPSSGSSISSSAIGSVSVEESHPAPEPYNFAYSSANEDGSSSSREETGDESGRVTGFYTLVGLDGQERRVDYVADENGFRATVTTNEIGTESKNAADAEYLSSSPPIDQLIAEWEASHPAIKESNQQTAIRGAVGSVAVSRPANVATVVQKQTTTGSSSGGVSLIGVAPSAGGVTRTETVRTQTAGFGGTVIGVARPAPEVSRVQTVATQTRGSGGVSLVGIAPSQGVSRVQTVQTQSSSGGLGTGGLSVIGIGQPGVSRVQTVTTQTRGGQSGGVSLVGIAPSQGVSRVQTVHTSGGLGTGGVSLVGIGRPAQGVSRFQTVRTQSTSGGLGAGGVSLIGINRPAVQGVTKVQTVRTQTSGGSGAGGVSFVNLIPTQGVSQIQRVHTQANNELGAGGLSLVGISPTSGGVTRTESFRTQTSGGYGTYGNLGGTLQLTGLSPAYSSYNTLQNGGLQGLSLAGLQATNGENLVVVPGTNQGNTLLRYVTSNGFQASEGNDGQSIYFLPETTGTEQIAQKAKA